MSGVDKNPYTPMNGKELDLTPLLRWTRQHLRIVVGVAVGVLVAIIVATVAMSSGGGQSSAYQSGYRFGQAATQGVNTGAGIVFAKWSYGGTELACGQVDAVGPSASGINSLAPTGESVPQDELPPSGNTADSANIAWVNGCVAGFNS